MKILNIFHHEGRRNAGGQALAELLVGVGIGVLILGSAAAIIRTVVQSNESVRKVRVATDLARELMDSVRVYADSDWQSFYNLNKGSSNHYYVNISSSPFTVSAGDESVNYDGVTYTRYFYVENIERSADSTDSIVASGGVEDPSTQKVVVGTSWQSGNPLTFTEIFARRRNSVFTQSDWSSGTGAAGPLTQPGDDFFASTAIDASTTGQFKLLGF